MSQEPNLFDEYEHNYWDFDDQIRHNHDQISHLVENLNSSLGTDTLSSKSTNSLSNSSDNSLDPTCLRTLLTNLTNLIDYYKNQKLKGKNSTVIKYLLVKRFNYFNNNLLNLHKKILNETSQNLFILNQNYNNFDKLELNILNEILNKNLVKLSIQVVSIGQLRKQAFFPASDTLCLRVLQFEYRKKKPNQISKKSKRSLSAGPRIKSAKPTLSSDDSDSELSVANTLKISEKCLKNDIFPLESNSIFTLSLDQKTTRISIIVINTCQQLKMPILFELYELEGLQLSLINSQGFWGRKVDPVSSNMFRRIFKSKSKSRPNSNQSKVQRTNSNHDLNHCLQLNLNFSNELKNFLDSSHVINISQLDKWFNQWLPEIHNLNIKYNGYEETSGHLVNISMSLVALCPEVSQRRSKFDQHQISKNTSRKELDTYFYLKIIINKTSGFVSNLFKLKDTTLNDLIQLQGLKDLDMTIELYTYERNESVLQETKSINLAWHLFYLNRENIVLNFRNYFNLKFKIVTVHANKEPLCKDSIKFLIFELNDQNELEFYNLIKSDLTPEPALLDKYLDFFCKLAIEQKLNSKNLFWAKLQSRLFESFFSLAKCLPQNFEFSAREPKILLNWFLVNLKNVIELNMVHTLAPMLQNFGFMTKILFSLSTMSNSQFELKYFLNDFLLIRIGKHLSTEFLIENLNVKFLDFLPELFNGNELAALCIKLYSLEHIDSIELKNRLISLNIFSDNYQFRENIFEYVLNPSVDFLKCALRLKISQNLLQCLIKRCFGPVLELLITSFRTNDLNQSIVDNFLVLIELLDLIMSSNQYNYFDKFDLKLVDLFDVIESYFKFNQSVLNSQFNLCLTIDLKLFKFFKYIQKYLLRYLINKIDVDQEVLVFKAYFSMLFAFLEQKNSNYHHFFHKAKIMDSAALFWKCLNIRLKSSQDLNQFLVHKSIECLFNNCFFKNVKLKIDMDEIELTPLTIVLSTHTIKSFYQHLLHFLPLILPNKETFFFHLIDTILRHEKSKKNIYDQIDVSQIATRSHAKIVLGLLDPKGVLAEAMHMAFDYHFLKDQDSDSVSVTEHFLLLYRLIKKMALIDHHLAPTLDDIGRKIKLYLLDDLYYLNKWEKNHLLMSFIRKEQADLLQWQNESSLKEILYLKSLKKFAINSLQEKFLVNDSSYLSEYYKSVKDDFSDSVEFDICQKLNSYYEKIEEKNSRLAWIMSAESKFNQLMSPYQPKADVSKNHGHLFFRVGIFGKSLKFDSVQNKYYLYKHKSYEMLSNIQNLIKSKLSYSKWCESQNDNLAHFLNNVVLLSHNHEPDPVIKDSSDKCFVQICAVNKLDRDKFIELIDENLMDQKNDFLAQIRKSLMDHGLDQAFYYFDRPYYLKSVDSLVGSVIDDLDDFERVKENESVENLWIERSVLITQDARYDKISQFQDVELTVKIYLNPVRNAITDINEKTKELKNFVVQFTANSSHSSDANLIHNLQPLTMRLLGCLDARVNGGLIKYVKELLNETVFANKMYFSNRKKLFSQLYLSIKSQLGVLESGLSIHDRILSEIEENLSNPSETMSDHVAHMNELNKHLIECLRNVQEELEDKWSKFF
ncbi:dedicator of cytokinesis 3 isoform X1 [Brachionus plicatilis]|uniref:Dedicator of cytokinesis 3 isoform X1 n=1 Tax=Brachionus plicatilis TaxID=10195 RepID=A0A3M7REA7_BRAPC|nr:dedicator of cytokinesis 3 isoform X1 [Brachionus plicatilis]